MSREEQIRHSQLVCGHEVLGAQQALAIPEGLPKVLDNESEGQDIFHGFQAKDDHCRAIR